MKNLAIILGSGWFFLVSCTTGVVVGTNVIAKLDERDVKRGDQVHTLFAVAAEPGEAGKPFRVLRKDEIALSAPAKAPVSFRMSAPAGSLDFEGSTFSYRVLEDTGQEQLIELIETYRDGDNKIWSRYRATSSTVSPVSSRMFYFGYMFRALPFAFVIALILYFTGNNLRRKVAPPAPRSEARSGEKS